MPGGFLADLGEFCQGLLQRPASSFSRLGIGWGVRARLGRRAVGRQDRCGVWKCVTHDVLLPACACGCLERFLQPIAVLSKCHMVACFAKDAVSRPSVQQAASATWPNSQLAIS